MDRLQEACDRIGKINAAGLTLGQSLAGLKVIMKQRGLCEEYMLPPLTMLDEATAARIRKEAEQITY